MRYAGFWKRFGAWVLDMLITGIVAAILGMAALSLIALAISVDGGLFQLIAQYLAGVTILVMLLLHFVYYGFFWSQHGNSLGMKAFEIKVVRRKSAAQPSFFRAGLRGTVGYYISALILGVGYLWAAFDRNKQAWHDKVFDTIVVPEFPPETVSSDAQGG